MQLKRVKEKICRNDKCGKKFKPIYNSTQITCSYKCALEYNKPEQVKRRFDQIKNDAQPISYYEKKARAVFQIFIRLRDKLLPCISCGRTESKQFDGGHYFKAELYTGLIFNELNCNKQCCYCNRDLHGNLIDYRIGLVKKYGEFKVKELEASADQHRIYKFTKFELLEIEKHYKQKIKNLKNL